MRLLTTTIFHLVTLLLLCACLPGPVHDADPSVNTPAAGLATPVADSPAAGICVEHEGDLVSVTIYPDIPDPRCSYVSPDQHLRVINERGETLQVTLARLVVEIAPGEEHTFDEPFGALLLPGVHRFDVLPCCGAELILGANR